MSQCTAPDVGSDARVSRPEGGVSAAPVPGGGRYLPAPMPAPKLARLAAGSLALLALAAAGCGKSESPNQPRIGEKGTQPPPARSLGFPAFATKNKTRVGGADPTAHAPRVA